MGGVQGVFVLPGAGRNAVSLGVVDQSVQSFHPSTEISGAGVRVEASAVNRRHIMVPRGFPDLGQICLTMLTADLPEQIDSISIADVVDYSTRAIYMGQTTITRHSS